MKKTTKTIELECLECGKFFNRRCGHLAPHVARSRGKFRCPRCHGYETVPYRPLIGGFANYLYNDA